MSTRFFENRSTWISSHRFVRNCCRFRSGYNRRFDTVLTETTLQDLKYRFPGLRLAVLLDQCPAENMAVAKKFGASTCIPKPVDERKFIGAIRQMFGGDARSELMVALDDPLPFYHKYRFADLIGRCGAMLDVFLKIINTAASEANVVIIGESGTGKEMAARAIHEHSRRSKGSFIPVDGVAVSAAEDATALFGLDSRSNSRNSHEPGLLERAHGGTLFLNDITELDLRTQAKLVRVFEDRKLPRRNGRGTVALDIRILCATAHDPVEAIAKRLLRSDLYYCLNVVNIPIPALRDRDGDIGLLANYFLDRFCDENEKSIEGFSPEALDALQKYSWPGNVRELRGLVEHLVVTQESKLPITLKDIPPHLHDATISPELFTLYDLPFKKAKRNLVDHFEKQYIEKLLKRNNGNISHAAIQAGVNRKTLHRLLNLHKIRHFVKGRRKK